jgi:lipopolysaccharide export system permease protein
MRDQLRKGTERVDNKYGVWAKDANSFVSIGRMNSKAELYNVQLYFFAKDLTLSRAMVAKQATYQEGSWLLQEVSQTSFYDGETRVENFPDYVWETELTPKKLEVIISEPDKMSMRDIYDYITYLESNDQDASSYWLILWRKAVLPFTVVVMMLLSVSFIFGGLRSVPMGTRLIFGIASGFTFHVSGELFGPASLVFGLPPILGALLPSILVLVIAMYQLRKQT